MAKTQTPTDEGYAEIGKLLSGEAASAVKSVGCYKVACDAASEASTEAVPGGGASSCAWATENGVSVEDADTVASVSGNVANDTVQLDHVFTALETIEVFGFGVLNDEDDVLFAECCFNDGISLEANDQLTVQMKILVELGS